MLRGLLLNKSLIKPKNLINTITLNRPITFKTLKINDLSKPKSLTDSYDFGYLLLNSKNPSILTPNIITNLISQYKLNSLIGGIIDHLNCKETLGLLILGKLDLNEEVIPFYHSCKNNYKRKVVKVGRFNSSTEKDLERKGLIGWDQFKSISQPINLVGIPKELEEVVEVDNSLMLLLGDSSCDQYLESLDNAFPKTPKFGLIGSATPFLNGKPVTLYHNETIHSSGITGLLIQSPKLQFNMDIQYPNLLKLGSDFNISKCQGNIILELNGSNATNKLLQLLEKEKSLEMKSWKDVGFYLKVYNDNDENQSITLYKIISGDPKKGTMAIDTITDLTIGTKVEFYYQKPTSDQSTLSSSKTPIEQDGINLIFTYHPPTDFQDTPPLGPYDVITETGIIITPPTKPFTCFRSEIPGALAHLKIN